MPTSSASPPVATVIMLFLWVDPTMSWQSPGVINVTTDKASYRVADTIGVSVTNRLNQTVQASSQYSYCTIVTLERRQDVSWKYVAPCALLRPAANIDLAPDETLHVKLPPEEQTELRPQTGTYRVAFRYGVLDRDRLNHLSEATVYSEPFTVVED